LILISPEDYFLLTHVSVKRIIPLIAIPIFLISGCTTLDIQAINGSEPGKFHDLSLSPSYESNSLRIDILRQTYTESYGDSSGANSMTLDVPYHPMGFDLGNGLFFDLNKNLSFRIDSLLPVENPYNFSIDIANFHGTGGRLVNYRMKNDSLQVSYPPRNKMHFRYVVSGSHDSLNFHFKGQRDFSIVQDANSETYRNRKHKVMLSFEPSTGNYLLIHKNRKKIYSSSANGIQLEKYYIIRMNGDHTVIEVRNGRGSHKVIYSIINNDHGIFVYNRNFQGLNIRPVKKGIELYHNKKLNTIFSPGLSLQ
jgi:hypothetical protein